MTRQAAALFIPTKLSAGSLCTCRTGGVYQNKAEGFKPCFRNMYCRCCRKETSSHQLIFQADAQSALLPICFYLFFQTIPYSETPSFFLFSLSFHLFMNATPFSKTLSCLSAPHPPPTRSCSIPDSTFTFLRHSCRISL